MLLGEGQHLAHGIRVAQQRAADGEVMRNQRGGVEFHIRETERISLPLLFMVSNNAPRLTVLLAVHIIRSKANAADSIAD